MSTEVKKCQYWLEFAFGNDLCHQIYPEPILSKDWEPNDADRRAAWLLSTELRTRITTQPLHYLDGDEESALESVYQLFGQIRGLVKNEELEGATHFSEFSIYFLNRVIRPFTSKWYTLHISGHLKKQDVRNEFRQDLKELQPLFQKFTDFLIVLSEKNPSNIDRFNYEPAKKCHPLGTSISFPVTDLHLKSSRISIPGNTRNEFKAVLEAEKKEIITRRKHAGLADDTATDPQDLVGMSLSGGGIRSATLALGVLQSLGKTGVLRYVDYLSTVSGGGYLGTLLSCYLDNEVHVQGEANVNQLGLSEDSLPLGKNSEASLMIEHLRNNSRYLLAKGLLSAMAQILYGIAVQMLLVLTLCMTVAAIVRAIYIFLDFLVRVAAKNLFNSNSFDLSVITQGIGALILAVTLIMIALLPWVLSLRNKEANKDANKEATQQSRQWERYTLILSVLATLILVYSILKSIYFAIKSTDAISDLIILLAVAQFVVPVSIGLVDYIVGYLRKSGTILFQLAFFSASFIFGCLLLTFTLDVAFSGTESVVYTVADPWWLLFVGILVFIAILFLNINDMTLHRFYKNRLSIAYLVKTDLKNTKIDHNPDKLLSEMRSTNKALPYHLINAALNGTSKLNEGINSSMLNRRGAELFMFSQLYAGSNTTGYWSTLNVEAYDRQLTLATAMATSGAAVAPNMGTNSLTVARRILAITNIRLNYWFRVPEQIKNETFFAFFVKNIRLIWRSLTKNNMTKKNTQPSPETIPENNNSIPIYQKYKFQNAYEIISKKMEIYGDSNPSLWNLVREYFGNIPVDGKYLNLSDGGHVENLGLYELLRRKCKFIIAIDGEADPEMTRSAISKIVRYARQDLNTEVRIDTSRMALDENGFSRSHFTLGEIDYGNNGTDKGYLLYIKSSLSGNEPDDVLDYRRRAPDFPHQSTADQFFNEEQFEAYKVLGQHIGDEVLAMENIGGMSEAIDKEHLNIKDLFQELANNLLRM